MEEIFEPKDIAGTISNGTFRRYCERIFRRISFGFPGECLNRTHIREAILRGAMHGSSSSKRMKEPLKKFLMEFVEEFPNDSHKNFWKQCLEEFMKDPKFFK